MSSLLREYARRIFGYESEGGKTKMTHCRHPENKGNPCRMMMCPRYSYDWEPEWYNSCSYKSNYRKEAPQK